MLIIQGMRMVYRQAGLLDSFIQSRTQVKLILNNSTKIDSSKVPIKNRISNWTNNNVPKLQLSDPSKPAYIQFQFYRNDSKIGSARSVLHPGYPRKDCLDVVGPKYQIIGKFIYQAYWQWANYNQYGFDPKNQKPLSRNVDYMSNMKNQTSNLNKQKEKSSGWSLFGCFSQKKIKKDPQLPIKKVYSYNQRQLKAQGKLMEQPEKAVFYSAKCYRCR